MIPVPQPVQEQLARSFGAAADSLNHFGGGNESSDGIVYANPYGDTRLLLKVMVIPIEDRKRGVFCLEERLRFMRFLGENGAPIAFPLPSDACDRVRPLFAETPANRAVLFAPLDGYNPGHVFVDDLEHPRSACVVLGYPAYTGDIFLGGDSTDAAFNAAVGDLLADEVIPSMLADQGEGNLMFFSTTEAWQNTLDSVLSAYKVQRLVRTIFSLDRERFQTDHADWRERVPDGYRVLRADRELARQIPGAAELWGSLDSFMARGFGFCVLHGEAMVSRCQPVFIGDGRAELGVGTNADYRRRGLATLAGCACIEHCLDLGLKPEWGCFYNEASGALARRLGFVQQPDLKVHYVRVERPTAADGKGR